MRVVVLALLACLICAGCGASHRNTSPPAIHGKQFVGKLGGPPPANPAAGDVLFASQGRWSGSPTGFAYAWKDCDFNGANCSTAAGSPTNTSRYQIVSGDVGFTLRVAVTASYSGHPSSTVQSQPTLVVGDGTFPLSVSSNGRFLQTSSGQPFLMVGDSPQSVTGNLSEANATSYLSDRASHGFNAVWINLLCDGYTACNSNGTTADSIKPFSTGTAPSSYVLSSHNSTYFTRAHDIVAQAQTDGIVVLLDPIETGGCQSGGWITTLENNGDGTATSSNPDYAYGQYLGTTFGDLHNIIWTSGNDFQCIDTTADKNDALAVAMGIANTNPGALQTLEADFCTQGVNGATQGAWNCSSSSLTTANSASSTGWSSQVQINSAYTYAPTYGEVRTAYGESSTKPVIMAEANYEGQKNESPGTDGCGAGAASDSTARFCRLQEWWTMTSGATGQLYGGPCYGITNSTTLATCDSTGVTQLGYETTLLKAMQWQKFAPDTNGSGHLVTSGGGSCPTTGSMSSVTCVTAAITSDNTQALIYDPTGTTVTVDLTKLNGTLTNRWYDPTNGTFQSASHGGTTSAATFATPGTNNAGDSDWVLQLVGS